MSSTSGHARKASGSNSTTKGGPSKRASTSNGGAVESQDGTTISGSATGTASSTASPASATKTAALTRAASLAKKTSLVGAKDTSKQSRTSTTRRLDGKQNGNNGTPTRSYSSSSGSNLDVSGAAGESDIDLDSLSDLARMTREQLVAVIARERQEKELVETRMSELTFEAATTSESYAQLQQSQIHQEAKLQEAYNTASRFETELADLNAALEIASQATRQAEKDSREAQKRYTDQVNLLEAEQSRWTESNSAWQAKLNQLKLDHEQAMAEKRQSIISSKSEDEVAVSSRLSPYDSKIAAPASPALSQPQASPTFQIPDSTLEELSSLHARVAEMSTEQQYTFQEIEGLRAELEEFRRFNADLQEQNENYEVLLGERMLSHLHLPADSGMGSSANTSSIASNLLDGSESGRSRAGSSLEPLDGEEFIEPSSFESAGDGTLEMGAVAAKMTPNRTGRNARKRQSMAGLGGGFDLEAELDRARKEEEEKAKAEEQSKRKAKAVAMRRQANQSSHLGGREGDPLPGDVEELRKEVRLLRQENKGLSTYVSKILERIIGMEGFEKVLSIERHTPAMAPSASNSSEAPPPTPAKTGFLASISPNRPPPVRTESMATTASSAAQVTSPTIPTSAAATSAAAAATAKKNNRFSMDWIASSIWKGGGPKDGQVTTAAGAGNAPGASAPGPGLKPMMLSGGPAVRRSSMDEDEDDRKTRARLHSEMRLLGIDNSPATQLSTPGSVKIGNRAASNRMSGSSFITSPRPPSLPPKESGGEDASLTRDKEMRTELEQGRASGFTELPAGSAGADAIKVRGHRKRPSAGGRESFNGSSSVGLGLSYSRDSASTWSEASPNLGGAENAFQQQDEKRSSDVSQGSGP